MQNLSEFQTERRNKVTLNHGLSRGGYVGLEERITDLKKQVADGEISFQPGERHDQSRPLAKDQSTPIARLSKVSKFVSQDVASSTRHMEKLIGSIAYGNQSK
ncbi:hypothetical protein WN943_019024 [Citrus x changshan-huyou]